MSIDIIEASLRKEERACKLFYEQTIPYVYSIVQLYIRNQEFKKDIVQEIYARIFSKLDQYDHNKGSINNWIRKISINQCIMHLRKMDRSTPIVPIGSMEENIPEADIKLDELTRKDIEKILYKMPSGYRTIFLLIVMDGYTHEEVSELLKISRETSRSQLSRAKNWVRNFFLMEVKIIADGQF